MLSIEHLAAVAVIAAGSVGLALAARRRPGAWTTLAARGLAAVLVANEVGWWVYDWHRGTWTVAGSLPLQLCQAVTFVAAVALLTRRPLLAELAYFWAFAGSLQAILTPDLPDHFPSYPFIQYYLGHGCIIASALYLVVGLRLEPRRGAVLRVMALTVAYTAAVGLVDFATGADYMFLRRPPASRSLLDLLGPWPWYVLGATLLALVFFAVLDAPFTLKRFLQPAPPSLVLQPAEEREADRDVNGADQQLAHEQRRDLRQ